MQKNINTFYVKENICSKNADFDILQGFSRLANIIMPILTNKEYYYHAFIVLIVLLDHKTLYYTPKALEYNRY